MKALNQTLGHVLGLLIFCALLLVAFSLPGHASTQCASYSVVAERLTDRWQEVPRGRGLAANGGYVVLLFHDVVGGTWTVVGVMPDGTACILGSGTGWEVIDPAPAGTEG